MGSTVEPILGLEWLSYKLTNDSVLTDPDTGVIGGFHDIAPARVRSPYGIVRQLTAAADLMGLDDGAPEGETIWVPLIMQVILYDREQPNFQRLKLLARRVYTLLQRQVEDFEGGSIYGTYRTYVNASTEVVGDAVERGIEQQFMLQIRAD